jgi:hypothetical protein
VQGGFPRPGEGDGMMETIRELIHQSEAAKRCGVSDRTVRRWERDGLIEGKRVRGLKMYPLKQLEDLAGLKANHGDPDKQ